jgi:hypothetical protein
VVWRSVGEGRAEIDTVHCMMKTHHMRYGVALAGAPGSTPPGLSWTPWADPSVKVPDETAIAFGIMGMERKVPPL